MRTLRWRLTLWYGGMAAAVLILLASILYLDVRSSLLAVRRADVRDMATTASQILEETGSPASAVSPAAAVRKTRKHGAKVVIKDADGSVLAATSGTKRIPESTPSDATYPNVRRSGRYVVTVFSSQAIPGATGEVYSVLPKADPVLRRLLPTEVAGVVGALALMVGFGYMLTARALRPLRSVSIVAGELRRGKLGSRVNLPKLGRRRDEVGKVANSFDAMAESLERLFEAERESKETLRRVLADVSHELRTPLTSILGYLDVLDESGDKDPVVRQRALGAMREESGRMARLVEDLLVLARLDARREMPAELVDLVALAHEVIGDHPGRRIELAAPDVAVLVLADREALRRVISNLLSNAVKHTSPEKKIVVWVAREAQEAVLGVTDAGAGIPEDALPHVFERFYRAESSRSGEGAGLGLAIVRETVEALDGRVEVESVLGKGSTFTIRLPLSGKVLRTLDV